MTRAHERGGPAGIEGGHVLPSLPRAATPHSPRWSLCPPPAQAGLLNWDYAASPCLRSRLEFGVEATAEHLARVEEGERRARTILGLAPQANLRVRYLAGKKARIELDEADLPLEGEDGAVGKALREALLELGFAGVSMRSFRSGSVSGWVQKK